MAILCKKIIYLYLYNKFSIKTESKERYEYKKLAWGIKKPNSAKQFGPY